MTQLVYMPLYSLEKAKKKAEKKRKRKEKRKARRQAKAEMAQTKSVAKKFQIGRRLKRTSAELAFEIILNDLEIKFKAEHLVFVGHGKDKKFKFVDFYLSDYRTGIEIDGGYHFTPDQQEQDRIRSDKLTKKSSITRIIRFTNEEILNGDRERIAIKLLSTICPPVLKVFEDVILSKLMGTESIGATYGMYQRP